MPRGRVNRFLSKRVSLTSDFMRKLIQWRHPDQTREVQLEICRGLNSEEVYELLLDYVDSLERQRLPIPESPTLPSTYNAYIAPANLYRDNNPTPEPEPPTPTPPPAKPVFDLDVVSNLSEEDFF